MSAIKGAAMSGWGALVLRMAIISTIAASCSTAAKAQTLAELDEPLYQERASAQYWQYLASTPCTGAASTYSRSPALDRPNVEEEIRAALRRRVGFLPTVPAGGLIERHDLYRGSRYSVEFVQFTSRLTGVGSFGYWAMPSASDRGVRAPVVILINGAGTTPAQAFGWRLPGDGSLVRFADSSAFVGLGTDLVEAGYAVLSLWLNDQWQFSPLAPWLILDRWGAAYRATRGEGGAYSLILPQVMAAIDFARDQAGVVRGQVAIAGWEEGAQIAAVAAAFDPRIGAVVRLAPAIDWPAFRKSTVGIRHGASFTQMNCALGDPQLDALIAPRPLLHISSAEDPYDQLYRSFAVGQVESAVRDIFTQKGAASDLQFARVDSARQVRGLIVSFLDSAFRLPAHNFTRTDTRPSRPVDGEKYPFSHRDAQATAVANYIATTGVCRQVSFTPDLSSPENYRRQVLAFSDTLRAIGGFDRGPLREMQHLAVSRLLLRTDSYDLQYVRYTTPSGVLDVEGLLATPRGATGLLPAVLSLNGNDGLKRNFDIPPFPQEPYLNGVADYFASRGHIVFVPFLPRWFPEVASSAMRARDPGGLTSWSYVLPYYSSAVDILLQNPLVDNERIGIFGISYAGDAAITTAAFDSRIASVVYSNRAVDMRKAYSRSTDLAYRLVWSTDLCSLMDVEFKMIAPRRLVWEAEEDPYFNDPNMTYIRGLRDLYELLGKKSSFQFIRQGGGHETRPAGYRFFDSGSQD